MPYQSAPRPSIVQLVESLGGSIWTTCTDMANGGIDVARTQIEQMDVPSAAKTLLGWRPIGYPCDQAVAESFLCVYDIRGKNYNFQPQEVICGNVAPSLLLIEGMLHAASEYYDVFAPCEGGDIWDIGIEPCDAIAGNTRVGAEFTWTDIRLPLPTIRSQCSREIAIAIAAVGEVAGLAMPITDAHQLIEVGGAATQSVNTVFEELNITLVLRCTALPMQEIRAMFEPCGCAGITPASSIAYVSRRLERMRFSQESVTITSAFDVDVALAAAGQAAHYIRWI